MIALLFIPHYCPRPTGGPRPARWCRPFHERG